jgi:hypothetical protein
MLVAWQGGGMRCVSRIRTLGMGGVFITTPNPPPVGTILRLVFQVPGGDVHARGTVANVKPGKGMGIEFKGMAGEERARLARLLRRLLQ